MSQSNKEISEIAAHLRQSKSVLVITGAGISAESGLPTYRGVSGLYNNKDTEDGMAIETALSGTVFRQDPTITWKYISQIESACRGKKYNRAHEVLAKMDAYFDRVCVFTQNIDGFHHAAGSKCIIDIHGNIQDLYCISCDYKKQVKDYSELETIPPRCPKCNEIIRPDVVLFDEMLPLDKLQMLEDEKKLGFDIVFTIGTTSVFPYIAQPIIEASRRGIPTVEINPGRTQVSSFVDYKITEKAGVFLDQLWLQMSN